jgi:hypothetical protein
MPLRCCPRRARGKPSFERLPSTRCCSLRRFWARSLPVSRSVVVRPLDDQVKGGRHDDDETDADAGMSLACGRRREPGLVLSASTSAFARAGVRGHDDCAKPIKARSGSDDDVGDTDSARYVLFCCAFSCTERLLCPRDGYSFTDRWFCSMLFGTLTRLSKSEANTPQSNDRTDAAVREALPSSSTRT